MDHEVMEVLRALGCFSGGVVEEFSEPDAVGEFDELYHDVGGEG